MKILILCYEYPPIGGGGAKVVAGLAPELSKQGHQIDLVTMSFKDLPRVEKQENLTIYRVPCIRRKAHICTPPEMMTYLISALPFLIKLVRKNKYDINHTHFIYPDALLSLLLKKLFKLPYLVTAHGSDVPGYNPNRFIMLHKFISPIWKIVVKNASKIICPSNSIKELLLKVAPKTSTQVIPNGIDLHKFSSTKTKKNQILIVTRIFERKGVQYFLEAIKGFDHGYSVNIVGDGPYLKNLEQYASDENLDVTFHGFVDNKSEKLKELYESSKIFVFTSEAENFPIVLLEAMSAGLAVITTNNSGCAEVIGDTGILVPPNDSASIKEALVRLINDDELCKTLGTAARLKVDQEFGWEAIAKKHVELYDNFRINISYKKRQRIPYLTLLFLLDAPCRFLSPLFN